ncbi:MAG: OmpH family outer membrane protein [Acidihalobacter sp.]
MRKVFATLVVFMAAAFAVPAASAAGAKIGFVNVQQIMAKAPQAEAARAQLKKEFGSREKSLRAQRSAIQKQESDLKRNSSVMSADKKNSAQKALRDKMNSFNRDMSSFRNDFNMKRNELLQGLQKRISDAIVKVAKDGGFDLVLTNGVAYASNKVDLTKQVLAELAKSKN